MTHDIFQGPSVLPSLSLSLSLCLHFLSFARLCSLLTLSTHSSLHKLALVFVFKSACGFTKHSHTHTHTLTQGYSKLSSENPLLGISLFQSLPRPFYLTDHVSFSSQLIILLFSLLIFLVMPRQTCLPPDLLLEQMVYF